MDKLNGKAGSHQTNLRGREREIKNIKIWQHWLPRAGRIGRILTWVGTCAGPCPCRACTRGSQPVSSRTRDRSWAPSFSCPGGKSSYGGSCRWSNRPTGRRRSRRRTRCGRWTPGSCGRGRSGGVKIMNRTVSECIGRRWNLWRTKTRIWAWFYLLNTFSEKKLQWCVLVQVSTPFDTLNSNLEIQREPEIMQ